MAISDLVAWARNELREAYEVINEVNRRAAVAGSDDWNNYFSANLDICRFLMNRLTALVAEFEFVGRVVLNQGEIVALVQPDEDAGFLPDNEREVILPHQPGNEADLLDDNDQEAPLSTYVIGAYEWLRALVPAGNLRKEVALISVVVIATGVFAAIYLNKPE